jgi:hypothetical protein
VSQITTETGEAQHAGANSYGKHGVNRAEAEQRTLREARTRTICEVRSTCKEERQKCETRAALDPRALRRGGRGERWELGSGSEIWRRAEDCTALTLRSALEMTRSARAVEARTAARRRKGRRVAVAVARRRGGSGVAIIFPRPPDRVAARSRRRRLKPSGARAPACQAKRRRRRCCAAAAPGQVVSGGFAPFFLCDLDIFWPLALLIVSVTPKNPSHNRKMHLFLSPTVQLCIEIRASTLIY